MNLSELEKKRDQIVTNFFWLALYTAFIFGIPAVIAIFVGNKINEFYGVNSAHFVMLFLAFILSWIIVAIEYKRKTKILKDLNEKIKQARLTEKK